MRSNRNFNNLTVVANHVDPGRGDRELDGRPRIGRHWSCLEDGEYAFEALRPEAAPELRVRRDLDP
jgi:hypothetical protein